MTRTTPVRAVIFDFDGTLLNSLPLVLASIAHAIEPFGARPTMDIFAHLGGPPDRFLPLLVNDPKHVPVALSRMDAYHDANSHLLDLFDGTPALLEGLRSAQIKVGIWTGRDRLSTEALLGRLNLSGHLDGVVCGDDLPTHKPDPAGLQALLRQLEVQAAEALFLGDADVDVLGGHACGVDTILIRHSRQIADEIVAKSWAAVATPRDAFDLVVRCVAPAPAKR